MSKPVAKQRGHETGRAHLWIRHNILGLVAIFIALGGTAIAASVGSHDSERKAHTSKKRRWRGPAGPQGQPGAQGGQGLQGDQGAQGIPGTTFADVDIYGVSASVGAGPQLVEVGVTCAGADTPAAVSTGSDYSLGAVLLGS